MAAKTEAPTPGRLRRAIAEGDVAVSGVLTRWAVFAVGALLLPTMLAVLGILCLDFLKRAITQPITDSTEHSTAAALLRQSVMDVALVLVPWLAALAIAAVLVTLLQTRGALKLRNRSTSNQHRPFGHAVLQVFDGSHWGTLLVALGGALATGALGVYLVAHHLQSFANAAERPLATAPLCFTVMNYLAAAALSVGLCAAAADFLIRAAGRQQRLRMTRAEWLEDQRAAHGDPAVRSERQRRASTP